MGRNPEKQWVPGRGGWGVRLCPGLEDDCNQGHIPCQSSPGGQFPKTRSHGHPWAWWRRCPSSPAASPGSTRPELGARGEASQGVAGGEGESRQGPAPPMCQPWEDKVGGQGQKSLGHRGRKRNKGGQRGLASEGGTIPVPVLCFLHPLGALTEGTFCCLTPALPQLCSSGPCVTATPPVSRRAFIPPPQNGDKRLKWGEFCLSHSALQTGLDTCPWSDVRARIRWVTGVSSLRGTGSGGDRLRERKTEREVGTVTRLAGLLMCAGRARPLPTPRLPPARARPRGWGSEDLRTCCSRASVRLKAGSLFCSSLPSSRNMPSNLCPGRGRG